MQSPDLVDAKERRSGHWVAFCTVDRLMTTFAPDRNPVPQIRPRPLEKIQSSYRHDLGQPSRRFCREANHTGGGDMGLVGLMPLPGGSPTAR